MKKVKFVSILTLCLMTCLCLTLVACSNSGSTCHHDDTVWERNEEMHFRICRTCGETLDEGSHMFDSYNSEGQAICTVCGYVQVGVPGEDKPGDHGGEYEDDDRFQFGVHSNSEETYINVDVLLENAENTALEIPSVSPDRQTINGDPNYRTVTGVEFVGETFNDKMYTSIVLPDTIDKLDVQVSDEILEKLKAISLHEGNGYYFGTKTNPHYALWYVDPAEEITLHADTKVFGNFTFRSTRLLSLKKVVLPTGLKRLPMFAFDSRARLQEVVLPGDLKTIPYSALGNTRIQHIEIPNSVTTICDYAFDQTPLKELIIPNSVTKIGANIFDGGELFGTSHIAYVEIGSGVTEIDENAFDSCKILEICNKSSVKLTNNKSGEGIYVDAKNVITNPADTKLTVDSDGFKFFEAEDTPICYDYSGDKTAITFPSHHNDKAYVPTKAFGGFTSCTELTFPTSVKYWSSISDIYSCNDIAVPTKIDGTWRIIQEFWGQEFYTEGDSRNTTDFVVRGNIEIKRDDTTYLENATFDNNVQNITRESDNTRELSVGSLTLEDGALKSANDTTIRNLVIAEKLKAGWGAICNLVNKGVFNLSHPGIDISHPGLDTLEITSYDPATESELHTEKSFELKNLVIDEGVTTLPNEPFKGYKYDENKDWLQSVTLPNGFTAIPESMFENAQFEQITLPSTVTSIGKYAFSGCSSLKTVNLPAGLESIGVCAFIECNSLQLTELPSDTVHVGLNAFSGSSVGERVGGVIYLGKYAIGFDGTTKTVTLRDGTTKLLDRVYRYEYSTEGVVDITSLTLPASLTEWESLEEPLQSELNQFDGFKSEYLAVSYPNMTSVAVKDGGTGAAFAAQDGLLYNGGKTELLFVPKKFDFNGVKELPETLAEVDSSLFEGTSVTDSNTEVKIGDWVVYIPSGDDDGEEYQLQDGVKYASGVLGNRSYKYNGGVYGVGNVFKSVEDNEVEFLVLRSDTVEVATKAFENCSKLYGVYFPASVKKIGEKAFWGCDQGVNRYFEGERPSDSARYNVINDNNDTVNVKMEFTNVILDYATHNLYVEDTAEGHDDCLLLCGNTDIKNAANNEVTMPDSFDGKVVSGIADFAFNRSTIKSLVMQSENNHVKTIGDQAFEKAEQLTKIDVKNIVDIGAFAFSGTSLTEPANSGDATTATATNVKFTVTLPNEGYALNIQNNAFEKITELVSINFNTGNIIFGCAVFNECTNLTHVYAGNRTEWWSMTITQSGVGNPTKETLNEGKPAEELAKKLRENPTKMFYYLDLSKLPTTPQS